MCDYVGWPKHINCIYTIVWSYKLYLSCKSQQPFHKTWYREITNWEINDTERIRINW